MIRLINEKYRPNVLIVVLANNCKPLRNDLTANVMLHAISLSSSHTLVPFCHTFGSKVKSPKAPDFNMPLESNRRDFNVHRP